MGFLIYLALIYCHFSSVPFSFYEFFVEASTLVGTSMPSSSQSFATLNDGKHYKRAYSPLPFYDCFKYPVMWRTW